ncbi:MAG: acetyl-CoA carboxylase biotin carboxyl carrier protein [Chlamydiae bacterium]|nr:acetyl-CoA carboxylase biotin carboxyl carrier protein [Chlamydiota bacterium]
MELKQIKELMAAMEKAGIKKLSIKEKTGYELQLERFGEQEHLLSNASQSNQGLFAHPSFRPHDTHGAHFPIHHMAAPVTHAPAAVEAKFGAPAETSDKIEGKFIQSPMVGTYYTTPSPDDPVFVQVGDKVNENTVVCIVEAMKVMNEVKAGMSGVITEICLENGQPVEFGTKLFRIV